MGGMLAVRLARAYGSRIDHLVLYSPIGLEDYRFYAPPVTDEVLANNERALSADGYRKQLMTNYALSLPSSAIEPFVQLREQIKESGEYPRWLKSFVASYQMIYSQPVAHEIPLIDRPTLFIMGANDHNAPGRSFASPELRAKMGKNPELAQTLAARMANAESPGFRRRWPSRASRSDATLRRNSSEFSRPIVRFATSPIAGPAKRLCGGALSLTIGGRPCEMAPRWINFRAAGGDMPASMERRAIGACPRHAG